MIKTLPRFEKKWNNKNSFEDQRKKKFFAFPVIFLPQKELNESGIDAVDEDERWTEICEVRVRRIIIP